MVDRPVGVAQPGALIAVLWRDSEQVASRTLHAVGGREDQRQVGEFGGFGRERQRQAAKSLGQIESDVQRIAEFRVAIALVAAPQRDQPALGTMRGAAESEQVALADARRVGQRRVIGKQLEFDGLI